MKDSILEIPDTPKSIHGSDWPVAVLGNRWPLKDRGAVRLEVGRVHGGKACSKIGLALAWEECDRCVEKEVLFYHMAPRSAVTRVYAAVSCYHCGVGFLEK